MRLAEYGPARDRYIEALPIYREIGDRLGEANCIQAVGDLQLQWAEYGSARQQYEAALQIYQAIKAQLWEANSLKALGDVSLALVEYETARRQYGTALAFYRKMGDKRGEAACVKAVGDVHLRLGEFEAALAQYEMARSNYGVIGSKLGEVDCIQALGSLYMLQGQYNQAQEMLVEAIHRYHTLNVPGAEANTLISLASLYETQGDYPAALKTNTQALTVKASPWGFCQRARLYLKLSQADPATQDLEAAANLQPDYPYLYLGRGDLALLRRDYSAAELNYQAVLKRHPRQNMAYFGLGEALLGLNRPDEAMVAYRSGLEWTYLATDLQGLCKRLEVMQLSHPDQPGLIGILTLCREVSDRLSKKGAV